MLPIVAGAAGTAGRALLQGVGQDLVGKGLETMVGKGLDTAKDLLQNAKSGEGQGNAAQNTPPQSPVTW